MKWTRTPSDSLRSRPPLLKGNFLVSDRIGRNQKDYNSYNNENKQLEQKLEQLKEQNADEIDIKKMNEQILETAQMLPNSKVRIENALEDLKNFMSEHEEN